MDTFRNNPDGDENNNATKQANREVFALKMMQINNNAEEEGRTGKDEMNKKILDVCCGVKGMWFNKKDNRVLFLDKRNEVHNLKYPSGNYTERIEPDIIGDFTDIKQIDNSFHLVVFDPPHIERKEPLGRITKKYGILQTGWEQMITKGFEECFRVLKPNGVLIFKWNECNIPVKKILALTPQQPLFGHKSGKSMQTHWICFMKS